MPDKIESESLIKLPRETNKISWWFWILMLTTILLPRLAFLGVPPARDQESVGVAAEMINHGYIPYRDCIIMRGPLYLLIHCASIKAIGHSIQALNVPDLFCWTGFAIFTVLLARSLWGKRAARFAGFSLTLLSVTPLFVGCYVRGEVEEWIGLCWLFAAYQLILAAKGSTKLYLNYILVGAAISCAFLIKTTGIVALLPCALSALYCIPKCRAESITIKYTIKSVLSVLMGAAIPIVPIFLYLYKSGGLFPAYEVLFKLAFEYTKGLKESTSSSFIRALFDITTQISVMGWVFWIACWGTLVYELQYGRRWLIAIPASFLITAILINTMQTFVGYRDLLHITIFAAFAGRGFDLIIKHPQRRSSETIRILGWTVLFLILLIQSRDRAHMYYRSLKYSLGRMAAPNYFDYMNSRTPDWHFVMADDPYHEIVVGEYIKNHSSPNDKIEVWDSTGLVYYAANRLPATPHLWHQFMIYQKKTDVLDGRVGPNANKNFLVDIKASKPAFIVVRYGDTIVNPWQYQDSMILFMKIPGMKEFLKTNYKQDIQIQMGYNALYRVDGGGYILYRRKDLMPIPKVKKLPLVFTNAVEQ